MSSDYLDDEQLIADERERDELFDSHALRQAISELELQPVVMLSPTATVRQAIGEMVDKRVGCVLIVQDGQLVGVFSERDVLQKVAGTTVDLDGTPVSSLMTPDPETLPASAELVYALHKMAVGGYRHVPLMDDDGQPVAVVSMRDLVNYIVSLYPNQILKLPDNPNRDIPRTAEGA